ncbi:MAG TPA: DedA family protein, partial [Alphaproteobacteria bacterium]|nr:DedA family protein [Alphaproteobacteria bacterium]
GALQATFLTVIGATIGATIVFLIARNVVGETLRQRAGPIIHKIEAGFQKNGLSYMLMLRLVPVFPFGLVNIAAAVLGVRLSIFLVTTAIGIIPAVFVVSLSGAGLDLLLQSNEEFSMGNILSPPVIAALTGLAALASVPILYKHLRGPGVQRQHKTRRDPPS